MTNFPDITLMKASKKNDKFNWYRVREDCVFTELWDLTIPEGFTTDFSSVPRFLWPLVPPHGLAAPASVLHDYFYVAHPFQNKLGADVERYFADKLFYDLLIKHGIKKWQAKIMYLAVRWFGKNRYKNNGDRN